MKITFILPAIGKKPGEKYIGTWKMEPLMIAVLKAHTPADIVTEFFDDRLECPDYDTPTDLVVITVETYTAKRSYQIAGEFRKRGVPVVMGGYHVTLLPEEAARYANSLIIGNAESVWGLLLEDFRKQKLQGVYRGAIHLSEVLPDRNIFAGKKYLPISLVETGRGCCHRCEFCAISSYYQGRYYPREHGQIIRELQNNPNRFYFLVDDNLVADKNNLKALLQQMVPLQIKWAGQGTLSMAKDPELLKLLKKSGCELMLIGFESLEEESLRQMNKSFNAALGERDELVKRIHDAGIGIYATFVFGYDGDTERTFTDTLRFARKHRFYTAAFNHLLPFPGTKLYQRLAGEKRLLYDKWWLDENYIYGDVAFQPKNMSPQELSRLCRQARKEFSSFLTVLKRSFGSISRSHPIMWLLFWSMNLRLGKEIDEKMKIPLGRNLDELPK